MPFQIARVASKFDHSAGLRVPTHLLQSGMARNVTPQVRHYSTAPHSNSDREPEPGQSEGESRPSILANTLGFQSLSGLFSQPIRGRYSRARERAPVTGHPSDQPPPSSTNHGAPKADQTQAEPNTDVTTPGKKMEMPKVESSAPEIVMISSGAEASDSESTVSGFEQNGTGSRPTRLFRGDGAPEKTVRRQSPRQSLGPKRQVSVAIGSAFRRQFDANEKKPLSSAIEHGTRQTTVLVRTSGQRNSELRALRRRTGRLQLRPNPWPGGPMQEAASSQQHSDVVSSTSEDQPHSKSLAAVQTLDSSSHQTATLPESKVIDSDLPAASHQAATTPTPRQSFKAGGPSLAHKHRSASSKSSSSDALLTHVLPTGEAYMVDVGPKEVTRRVAIARSSVRFSNKEPLRLIHENENKKGDVLGVARIAGIMAAKRTSDLIPLCHPIAISKVVLDLEVMTQHQGVVTVEARVECRGQTGVEMEALTAASVAALTVFDMCKAVDKEMYLARTRVVYKSGGKTGVFDVPGVSESRGRQWFIDRGLELPPGLVEIPDEGLPGTSQASKADGPLKDAQQATRVLETNNPLENAQHTSHVAEPDGTSQSPRITRFYSSRGRSARQMIDSAEWDRNPAAFKPGRGGGMQSGDRQA